MDIPRTSSNFDLPESKNMQNTVMVTVIECFLATLNKSLRTSPETNFRLSQVFNWSKNNFFEYRKILKVTTPRK